MPVSNELTQDKFKWLQEEAFAKQANDTTVTVLVHGEENVPVSHELIQDKVKWLQEEAFAKENKNDNK